MRLFNILRDKTSRLEGVLRVSLTVMLPVLVTARQRRFVQGNDAF